MASSSTIYKNKTFFVILDLGRNNDITPGKTKSEYMTIVPQLNSSNATLKSSVLKDSEGDTRITLSGTLPTQGRNTFYF